MLLPEPDIVTKGRKAWVEASDELLAQALITSASTEFFTYVQKERGRAWKIFQYLYWLRQFLPRLEM